MTTATAPAEHRTEHAALVALDKEIELRRATLEASAASLIDPRRLKGVVLSAFSRNPSLWDCDPISVARAVVEAAQYGLEPTGAIGGAHLVPFKNNRTGKYEAQLIIDYRGYITLARRSGEVSKVVARIVREKDAFNVEQGSVETLVHHPYLGQDDPGNITHVYAVISYRDGSTQHDWDTKAWVETIRKRSKAKDSGPWVTDYAEMAKKSILRRLLKTAPLTVEARRAIEFEEQNEAEGAAMRAGRSSALVANIQSRLGVPAARADEVEGESREAAPLERPETPVEPEAAPEAAGSDAAAAQPAAATPASAKKAAPVCGKPGLTEGVTCVREPHIDGSHDDGQGTQWL